jgi:hypothetical protein
MTHIIIYLFRRIYCENELSLKGTYFNIEEIVVNLYNSIYKIVPLYLYKFILCSSKYRVRENFEIFNKERKYIT